MLDATGHFSIWGPVGCVWMQSQRSPFSQSWVVQRRNVDRRFSRLQNITEKYALLQLLLTLNWMMFRVLLAFYNILPANQFNEKHRAIEFTTLQIFITVQKQVMLSISRKYLKWSKRYLQQPCKINKYYYPNTANDGSESAASGGLPKAGLGALGSNGICTL